MQLSSQIPPTDTAKRHDTELKTFLNQLETEQNLDVVDMRLAKDSLRDSVKQLNSDKKNLTKPLEK